MYIAEEIINCSSRSDRVEIFPFYDIHFGKVNCAEKALSKQIAEILKREQMPNRHARVVFGGDQVNAINPGDVRRFDFHELADWLVVPTEAELRKAVSSQEVANIVKEKLSNLTNQEVQQFVKMFGPVKHLIIGALEGNHEKKARTSQNVAVHNALCDRLGIRNLSDETIIRFKFRRGPNSTIVKLYLRHGYGSGRTAGAEPCKLQRMLDEWEDMDVCLSGHSHSYCIIPPKPILYIPNRGHLPARPHYRYRFAANPGCWLLSHAIGQGTYESMAAYPARPMMTLKIVIWPFWQTKRDGKGVGRPKIELRSYNIL